VSLRKAIEDLAEEFAAKFGPYPNGFQRDLPIKGRDGVVARLRKVLSDNPKDDSYNARAWKVDTLPCPVCGRYSVIGYLLLDENDNHQHTKYVCTFWSSAGTTATYSPKRCGWEGWSVPGWDKDD
jgi:hypothetical protein